ncbi:MAG: hypothetical protein QF830_09550, partial [Rhodospirillales bacterium]|nr:hypothetical protein [Rhodospirillales bacterium]
RAAVAAQHAHSAAAVVREIVVLRPIAAVGSGVTVATPVIAVTAAAMPKDVEEGKKAGFREYFIKPFDISKFNKTIGKILAGHKSLV